MALPGLIAVKISIWSPACDSPSAAITRNQTSVIGPKNTETRAVPWLCTQNRQTRIATVIGSTYWSKCGAMSSRPSTADSTEIAGVIAASP